MLDYMRQAEVSQVRFSRGMYLFSIEFSFCFIKHMAYCRKGQQVEACEKYALVRNDTMETKGKNHVSDAVNKFPSHNWSVKACP